MVPSRTVAVDIHTVARRARVSIATVSRVMNHVASVDPKLAARVMKAAEELHYTPNTQARALVSGRSRLIGLIVSEIINPFFPELIQNFEDATVSRGYELLIGSTNYSPARMTQCVRRMVERKVEGVAVMTFGMDEDLLEELAQRGIPVVSVGSTRKLKSATSIEVNYRQGIQSAVEHLAEMGHRRISFISGSLKLQAAKKRQDAYIATMSKLGIKALKPYMIEGDHTMEGGFAAAERLFDSVQMPTAIVCSNDMTAIGVLHSASGRGLRVPEDVSVIGFDDIHMAQFTVPPLTTVRMSCSDLAAAALDALPLAKAGTPLQTAGSRKIVPTRLIVRQTSGVPRDEASAAISNRSKPDGLRKRSRSGI
jgi:DNA-binding LacI/PurR family transcriptional regulator